MRDLFGDDPDPPDDQGEIALALHLHGESASGKAWLLGDTDKASEARWTPKSQVRRGEGREENIWTVPVWLARDRGWI